MQNIINPETARVGRVKISNPEALNYETITFAQGTYPIQGDTDACDGIEFAHEEEFAAYGYR